MRRGGRGGAAVVLGGEDGGFAAGGLADDLFDVLVAALRGFPGRFAEGSRLEGDIERVKEGLVRLSFGFGWRGRHFGGRGRLWWNLTKE